MHRLVTATLSIFLLFVPDAIGTKARAVGLFEDAAVLAGFLSSRAQSSVEGRVAVSDAAGTEASLFTMAATFQVNDWFLFQFEIPHVNASVDGRELDSSLGDLLFRGRFNVAGNGQRRVRMLWGVGTGSGTRRVFPYSSHAIEFSAALAVTDTVEMFEYWASAGGVTFQRAPAELVELGLIENFWRVSAGIAVPFGELGMRLGTSILAFREGGSRDHYFARATWDYNPMFRLFATAQIEGGAAEDRVTDTSANVGMTVYF